LDENQPADDDRVRDHLANERTYLAWLRTGVSTMGFGVVIAKLRYLFPAGALAAPASGIVHASDIGLVLALIGLATVLASFFRFLRVRQNIRLHKYQADSVLPVSLAALIFVLGLVILWYLLNSR
jgi:putative membrane protein